MCVLTAPSLPPLDVYLLLTYAHATLYLSLAISTLFPPSPILFPVGSVGTLCAIVNGVGNPLIALLMGSVVTSIGSNFNDQAKSVAEVKHVVIQFTYVGAIICVTSYIQMCAFSMSAENQTKRIREKYLHAILRQDIAWHDTSKNNESLNSRLSADTQLIFEGLADKVGVCLSGLISFVTGFVIAFCYGWRMTLVLLCVVPVLAGRSSLFGKPVNSLKFRQQTIKMTERDAF